jgi:drug/metabolite transporter (DMT)-like permease
MRWIVWVGFAVLCVLSGTSWVIPDAVSDGLPSLEQHGLLFGLIGLVALLGAGRGWLSRIASVRWVRLAAAFVGFFGGPIAIVEYARSGVAAMNRSALFAMVPVVVMLAVAAGDGVRREERGARRFLFPALVGIGGLLLLLPVGIPGSVFGRVMLGLVCVAVVMAGLSSVWLYRLLQEVSLLDAIAIAGLANAVFLLVCSGVGGDFIWRWSGLASIRSVSSLVDGVEVVLLVWLLREMPPVRFAARYLAIPLITILEGYVLIRPEFTVRMGFGTVLLAVGIGAMLFLKAGEEEAVLSLR